LTGCDTGTPSSGNDSSGYLTITDIPAQFNGKYVLVQASSGHSSIMSAKGTYDVNLVWESVRVTNGSATITVRSTEDEDKPLHNYTGSEDVRLDVLLYDTFPSFTNIGDSSPVWVAQWHDNEVPFVNGKATVSWDTADGHW
jgi:hypothetical protein